LPLRDEMNVWKWFSTHLSAISEFFILIGDGSGKK
jgi:hypothetical protein